MKIATLGTTPSARRLQNRILSWVEKYHDEPKLLNLRCPRGSALEKNLQVICDGLIVGNPPTEGGRTPEQEDVQVL